ncbi:TRAP transporter small permease [Oceanispirochaeta sp.]|jgi:TRAP-type C4-dicarboxylate transport system permease small subunit|uniref:TRAP transporter small permease n=1 Tax=Oceanispirochaeta sp. TaxID=2035350 RepID=UPI00261F5031|nr:TRAP transporter small permease [Oceanispirochaeta sp.]MDA3958720.1 TRAP transporter small permease [Oceanispirochaeta sp.]
MKTALKRAGKLFIDTIEIYIPFAAFVTLFIVFITGIFFRYFLKPLTWTLELSLICFIWTSLLGGLFAKREDAHVAFTMVYDAVSPLIQIWMRLIGHSLLVLSFAIGLIPSWKYVLFMGYKKSNVLKIPMDLVFLPFVIFLAFMIGRYTVDIYRDTRKLIKGDLS